MKLLYIAGPYRADTSEEVNRNITRAQVWAAAAAEKGWFPVVPHNLSNGLESVGDDQYWLDATLEVMRRCDAVFYYDGWLKSKGTIGEMTEARRLGMPIYKFEQLPDIRPASQDASTTA